MALKSLPPTHHLPLTTTTHTSRSGVRGAGDTESGMCTQLFMGQALPQTGVSLPASTFPSQPTPLCHISQCRPDQHSQHCLSCPITLSIPASDLSVPASTTLKHLDPPAQSCISRTYQPVSPCPSQPHHPVCASQHHPRASIPASITLSLPAVPHCLCQSEMNHFSLEDPPAHPSRMDRPVY